MMRLQNQDHARESVNASNDPFHPPVSRYGSPLPYFGNEDLRSNV